MLNFALLKSASIVINNPTPNQFTVSARFMNSSPGSTFSFYPFVIDNITIDKLYAENFADVIDINIKISPKDYALLQDQGQNLLCILTITYMNQYGDTQTSPAPVQKKYNVMINNPRDIRQEIPDIQMYTDPTMNISLRLIEPTVYQLRQTKINTIYQKCTVTQAIYDITSKFNISNIHLVPPDNTHVYDHIDIGSYQGISSIYTFLQTKVGVYQKGINGYIANGILYIYPAFETNPTYTKTAIFYQVDTGRFAGNHIFHKNNTNNVSIVINTPPTVMDLSIAGSENVGTGFIFTKAARLTDGLITIDTASGSQFTQDHSLSVSLDKTRTLTANYNNMIHIPSTDNPYPYMANIISQQASLMVVRWENADPFQIDPPQQVIYYYDKNSQMIKKTGMFESAKYIISNMKKLHNLSIFGCVGMLTLRLSPNEIVVV